MLAEHRESAERVRARIERGQHDPATFRDALLRVPFLDRDAWVDLVFGLDELPDDEELPKDCVPYLPCSIDVLLRVAAEAPVRDSDVFVDVGSGLGRAATFVHLLTGAAAIGVEIQPALVRAARELASRSSTHRVSYVEGDAATLAGSMTSGSVFFLYCPFSGERLRKVLEDLESIARTRVLRVCCVDLPLPPLPWLTLERSSADLAIHRSTLHDDRSYSASDTCTPAPNQRRGSAASVGTIHITNGPSARRR